MKSTQLYKILEKDFITKSMKDDWTGNISSVLDFVSENFKKRSMGLVCDFNKEINQVYTAVFPSIDVMQKILDDKIENAMLFVHHPAIWDIRKAPQVFQEMDRGLLEEFKERRISIYNLHVPLDNYGDYSTSLSLAKALGIKPEKHFGPYYGSLCGLFGKTDIKTVKDLRNRFESTVNHKVSLYPYGDKIIKNNIIAVIAGGGNSIEFLEEIAKENVNTFVTGITVKNDHSKKDHEFAERKRINILGGTHYSTERFACIAMCNYFRNLGLKSRFIEDKPVMEDM